MCIRDSCEQMYFGREDVTELTDRDGKKIIRPNVVGQTKAAISASLQIAPALDRIARQLSRAGYSVVRIPALIPDQGSTPQEDAGQGTNGASKRYPFLSYSNVLVEMRHNQPLVYLPHYGFEAMDQAALRAWDELGFQVKPVPGFATSAMYGGGLRCCTKVLLRN